MARAALPDEVAALRERRDLLEHSRRMFLKRGDEGVPEIRGAVLRMEELAAGTKGDFPLSGPQVRDLFDDLGGKILAAHAAEVEAHRALVGVVS